jgi:GxxExxY protein
LVVASLVVVEIKSVEKLAIVHNAQVLTYMRLLQRRTGLLMNVNEAVLKNGIRRLVL